MKLIGTRWLLVAAALLGIPILALAILQLIPAPAGRLLRVDSAIALPDSFSTLFQAAPVPRIPASLVLPDAAPTTLANNIKARYLSSPMYFEANIGQTDPKVKFIARGSGYGLFLAEDEIVLALQKPEDRKKAAAAQAMGSVLKAGGARESQMTVLRTRFLGANSAARVAGVNPRETKLNYLIGNNQSRWSRGVPCYGRVSYHGVYPGIDVVFYGNQRQLEYDFVVHPGADPSRIRMGVKGADRLTIDGDGNLVFETPTGELRQHKPLVSQEVAGSQRQVEGRFVVRGENEVGFEVASYDRTLPLTIDPFFSYATLLGGSGDDRVLAVANDAAENLYVTGETASANFPTKAGSYRTTYGGGTDVFVAKLNKTVTSLLYSTFVGGSGYDSGLGIGVDTFGNAYVTGTTQSSNFPTSSNATQTTLKGATDAFFFQLAPGGDNLIYSTYIGGGGNESAAALFLEPSGRTLIAGVTDSTDFPTVAGAYQANRRGGQDGFLCRFSPVGSLLASTYLGGTGNDIITCMTATGSGIVYLGGETNSTDFPVTNDANQATIGGASDGFITALGVGEGSTTGSDLFTALSAKNGDMRLLYSTFIGGQSRDWVGGIGVGPDGGIYAAGTTGSANFPVTEGAGKGAGQDVFLARLPAVQGSISTAAIPTAPAKKITIIQGSGDDSVFSLFFNKTNTYFAIVVDTNTPNFLNDGYTYPYYQHTVLALFNRNLGWVKSNPAAGYSNSSSRSANLFFNGDSLGQNLAGRVEGGISVPDALGYQRTYGGGPNDGFVAGEKVLGPPDSTQLTQSAPVIHIKGSSPSSTYYSGYSNINYYPNRAFSSLATTREKSGSSFSYVDTGIAPVFPVSLKPYQQQVYVAHEKMGNAFLKESRTGSIQWATGGTLVGMFLTWNETLTAADGAVIARTPLRASVIPHLDTYGDNNIYINNPGQNPVSAQIQIINNSGSTRSQVNISLNPGASMLLNTSSEIFKAPGAQIGSPSNVAAAIPQGYIRINGSGGLVTFMNFGREDQYLATLAGLDADEGGVRLYSPQYAVGGGYSSILSVINLDSFAGKITAQLLKDDGTAWAAPRQLNIGAYERVVISDPNFFVDSSKGLVQGYVVLSSDGPRLTGSIFFGDPELKSFGTALPLVTSLMNRIVFAQFASDASWYTGLALLNPNTVTANALIDVYESAGGNPKYTKTEVFAPGQRKIGVMTQFFPAMVGVNYSSGYITVRSDQALAGFALYGTNDLQVLSAVAGQKMP